MMVVLKFGGTSVADADAIARLVAIVGARRGARTAVVSAPAGVAGVQVRAGLAAVCAVGDGLTSEAVASDAFGVFDDASVHLVSRPHGRSSFAVIGDHGDAHGLVARLHDHFLPPSPDPSAALRRDRRDREQKVAV